MASKLSLVKEREWIAIAARVVAGLLKELDLNSCRLAAKRLGMNARTLAKLNPDHPGRGLKKETLYKILYRIDATFRDEQVHSRQDIDRMMSEAWNEIFHASFGSFVPRY
ncbi:MAG: hypothetical protein K2N13_04955 [Paraprevotella sp.]|nr:hypothetical protein [Paraprevotella sp.]